MINPRYQQNLRRFAVTYDPTLSDIGDPKIRNKWFFNF